MGANSRLFFVIIFLIFSFFQNKMQNHLELSHEFCIKCMRSYLINIDSYIVTILLLNPSSQNSQIIKIRVSRRLDPFFYVRKTTNNIFQLELKNSKDIALVCRANMMLNKNINVTKLEAHRTIYH